jgi:hypothetical protein
MARCIVLRESDRPGEPLGHPDDPHAEFTCDRLLLSGLYGKHVLSSIWCGGTSWN